MSSGMHDEEFYKQKKPLAKILHMGTTLGCAVGICFGLLLSTLFLPHMCSHICQKEASACHQKLKPLQY